MICFHDWEGVGSMSQFNKARRALKALKPRTKHKLERAASRGHARKIKRAILRIGKSGEGE